MPDNWKAVLERHLPPVQDLLKSGETYLGPAAGAALVVFALVIIIFGRKAAVPAGAWPCSSASAWRTIATPCFPGCRICVVRRPVALGLAPVPLAPALIDGLLAQSKGVPWWGGWRLRLGVGLIAALIIVPAKLPDEWPIRVQEKAWSVAAFTLIVALGWGGSERVARQSPGGAVGLGLSMAMFGASLVVAACTLWQSCAEAMTFPAAALLGISLVALIRKSDVGGAVPAVALLLPSFLLMGATESYSEVPWYAFLLAMLPPLTVGLLAIPPLSRLTGFGKWVVFWILCLGPTIAAVIAGDAGGETSQAGLVSDH